MKHLLSVTRRFNTIGDVCEIQTLGDGLINDTYLVRTSRPEHPDYVLQRINTNVFTDVDCLQDNITKVTGRLRSLHRNKTNHILEFITTRGNSGKTYILDENNNAWRMSVYISGSITKNTVTGQSAYDAGEAFGQFQADLAPIAPELKETIPGFHNLDLRLAQLQQAMAADPAGRLKTVKDLAGKIFDDADTMTLGERLYDSKSIPLRVCHCDTKINNMLYDGATGQVLCIIDLDTVMPSLIYSDYGDFLRTAASTTSEDDPDLNNIEFRHDIFRSFTQGYMSSAGAFLSDTERRTLAYGIARFPYMQAIRFLTDYINGDTYYKTSYPEHNLTRTRNQLHYYNIIRSLQQDLQTFIDRFP